jgi:peptidoglycan biosynthesis protein MviN/MurJ (putative lipid II flippase)
MLAMLGKVAVASAALAAVCAASVHWLLRDWATQSFPEKLAYLFGTMTVGGAVFTGCGVLLHIEELKLLQSAVMRRLRPARAA